VFFPPLPENLQDYVLRWLWITKWHFVHVICP
jgi:hypothetical protein